MTASREPSASTGYTTGSVARACPAAGTRARIVACWVDYGNDMAQAFDTLKVADSIEEAGLDRDKARTIADGIQRTLETRNEAAARGEHVLKVVPGIVTANPAIIFGLQKLMLAEAAMHAGTLTPQLCHTPNGMETRAHADLPCR